MIMQRDIAFKIKGVSEPGMLQGRMLTSFSACMDVPRKTGTSKALVSATGQAFASLVTLSLQASL